jgi:hypothetical protein
MLWMFLLQQLKIARYPEEHAFSALIAASVKIQCAYYFSAFVDDAGDLEDMSENFFLCFNLQSKLQCQELILR